MTSKGLPPAKDSLLAGPIRSITGFVLCYPKPVVVGAVVLSVAAILLTIQGLTFRTSRLDLLNPNSGYNQRWLAYLEEFGEDDDAVVVIEGDEPRRVAEVMDKLADLLEAEPRHFDLVWRGRDLSSLRGKALHYLPLEQLEALDRRLAALAPAVQGHWSGLDALTRLRAANERLEAVATNPDRARRQIGAPEQAITQLRSLAGQLSDVLRGVADERPAWEGLEVIAAAGDQFDSRRHTTDDGRLGMVLLRLQRSEGGFSRGTRAVDRLREILEEVEHREQGVTLGVTGLPVLENDEMRASQNDMARASLISLIGVAGLFIAGFGVVRHPLMTVLTLLLAMAWSFGYVTLAIGHLNILSVSFGVILIGLGIDFGIHYVARYQQLRATISGASPHGDTGSVCDTRAALLETAGSVGPGIVTGGLTTALAFCTAALTDFTGVAELGLIAGGGIVFCVIAALTVLPALIYLTDRGRPSETQPSPLPVGKLCWPLTQRPRLVLVITLSLSAVVAIGLAQLRFDHNLLNLQPRRLESVQLERRLLQRTDRSVWYALSMCGSREELLRRKAAFEKLASVRETEQIASLIPPPDARRSQCIQRLGSRLKSFSPKLLSSEVPLLPVPPVDAIMSQLSRADRLLSRFADPPRGIVAREAANVSSNEMLARLSRFQQRWATELLDHLRRLSEIADPEPPRHEDLPTTLVSRFVGKSGRHLLKVYARGNIWDIDALEQFVADVESVDPSVTGHPVQTFYASRQMQRSYLHAAVYALLAVAIVLMLDFGSVRCTLLAMLPLAVGTVQMFGVLGLLGIPLNPANMIALPLILGIGIDDGVHVIHDYLRQRGRYRLSGSTAAAILLTSATTMVGFGSMMFARHQGLQSLGQVLTIGVFCCLLASLVVLPTLLSWLTRHRVDEKALLKTSGMSAEISRKTPRRAA